MARLPDQPRQEKSVLAVAHCCIDNSVPRLDDLLHVVMGDLEALPNSNMGLSPFPARSVQGLQLLPGQGPPFAG